MARPKPVLLLILDGWGHRDAKEHNPIAEANLPNLHQEKTMLDAARRVVELAGGAA